MEEKKVIKISFGVAICMFIIFILLVALGITYYTGFVKNGVDHEQIDNINNNFQSEKEENNDVSDNTNIIEESNKEDNVIIKEVVKEIEKQVDVNDVIKLGYNQIAVLINGKPYVIPVYDRENNFENYQLYEVKNITGKVKALRQFNTGLDPSETHYLIMEDGSVYWIDEVGNNSTAEKIVDASKNIIDIVEENEIVYAVSKNGEKIKIAEMP